MNPGPPINIASLDRASREVRKSMSRGNETLTLDHPRQTSSAGSLSDGISDPRDSLFERFAWLYIFFREKLFRDDTNRMVRALWRDGKPPAGTEMIELGCGPGFYACRFAEKFPQISVTGIDQSPSQLAWAQKKATNARLHNCDFEFDNVLSLSHSDESFDALIASRLFTVLPDRDRAVGEMYRVLRSGGRCLIAEPRYVFWASIPLFAMWLIARFTGFQNGYREPSKAKVLGGLEFSRLFATQPWRRIQTWQQGRYQYALCEKG